MMMAQIFFAAH